MNESTWTAERIERLIQMNREGLGGTAIARELGCTRNAVCGKLFRLRTQGQRVRIVKPTAGKPACCKANSTEIPQDKQPDEGGIPFIEAVEANGCLWPTTGGWCGAERSERAYCARHHARAYQKAKTKEKPDDYYYWRGNK